MEKLTDFRFEGTDRVQAWCPGTSLDIMCGHVVPADWRKTDIQTYRFGTKSIIARSLDEARDAYFKMLLTNEKR